MNLFLLIFVGIIFSMLVILSISTEQYLYLMFLAAIIPVMIGMYSGFKDGQGQRQSFDARDYDVSLDDDNVRIQRNEPDFNLRDRIEHEFDNDRNNFDDVWRP